MLRRFIILAVFLTAGCRSVIGPFEHRDPQRVDDPRLTIGEQERRGRDRLAMPDQSPAVAPNTQVDYPSWTGR
jgi:hypothetical protein